MNKVKTLDNNAVFPPKFSGWIDVLETLFTSEEFKACGFRNENLRHYLDLISKLEMNYEFPLNEPQMIGRSIELGAAKKTAFSTITEKEMSEKYTNLVLEQNRFSTTGTSTSLAFEAVSKNAKTILGITNEHDFNLMRVCGQDDEFELYHPEDVLHTIRLGLVAILMGSIKGVEVNPFKDYYEITFRAGFNDPSRKKTINRKCYMSNLDKGDGIRHLDIWRVEQGHDDFSHVSAKVILSDIKMNEIVKNLFFVTNCLILKLEPRDVILSRLICLYDTKELPVQLNKKCKEVFGLEETLFPNAYCHNMKGKLVKKVLNRIIQNTKGRTYKQLVQKKSFVFHCEQLGILNLPSLLEESIWKEVELRFA